MLAERNQFVPASEIRRIYNMVLGREDVIDLTVGLPDFDTPQRIKEAAKKAIDDGFTRYTHNAGLIEVREAFAEKLKRDNKIYADPATEIMSTVGGMGALVLANLVLVEPKDEVIYPDPGFVSHYAHIKLAGGNPIPLQLKKEDGFGATAAGVEERLTERTKLLVLNSPNNPTGGVTSDTELRRIAELALEHNFYILADEAYELFRYTKQAPLFIGSLPGMKEHVLSLFSLSKTYAMTGWRIGFCTGPLEVIGAMTKLQEHLVAMPTSISQKAAEAAVAGPQDCVREMLDVFRKRRDIIVRGLKQIEGIELDPPQGAFYVFPDISSYGLNSFDLVMKILDGISVATVHGSAFGKFGEGFLRLCYAVSTDKIEEALRRLDTFMSKLAKQPS